MRRQVQASIYRGFIACRTELPARVTAQNTLLVASLYAPTDARLQYTGTKEHSALDHQSSYARPVTCWQARGRPPLGRHNCPPEQQPPFQLAAIPLVRSQFANPALFVSDAAAG